MTLDEQYQQTIDDQRTHLMQMQEDFNKVCDAAKVKAQEKLKQIPEDKKEERETVLKEQKATLEEALHKLKTDVDQSTKATMKKLEVIVSEKEKQILSDLETQMANL
ncbi:MAG: hypothetical protein WCT53_04615 [Candidatus Gracilibacteria bacterium]|jgi:hypothetical protein